MSLLNRDETLFVIIDIQERLMPVMGNSSAVEKQILRLVKGMKILNIPTLVTQQYTAGIGPTISSVSAALEAFTPIEKVTFSCMETPEFVSVLEATGKKSIVLCGIEAHVCVQQTALQLIDSGYQVYVIADCVSSRSDADLLWGLTRMGEAGVVVTTCESVLFELTKTSKAPEFKEISKLVK